MVVPGASSFLLKDMGQSGCPAHAQLSSHQLRGSRSCREEEGGDSALLRAQDLANVASQRKG